MIVSVIVSILLAILVVVLLYVLNQRTREKEQLAKQERRSWMLKIALEKSCQLPTVESDELAKIEPQLDRLMNEAKDDKDVEEKMRELIMSLYEEKVGRSAKEVPPVKATPAKDATPPRRPPMTGRGR